MNSVVLLGSQLRVKESNKKTKKAFKLRGLYLSEDSYKGVHDLQLLELFGYHICTRINKGSFATVYEAEKKLKGKQKSLAVKVINRDTVDLEFEEKFLPRELDNWSQISHPNIIHVEKILHTEVRTYIFMELATNGTIIEYLQCHGAVSEPEARIWFYQLVSALRHCHRKGIAHRDVKCENLLLTSRMDLKLTDFGFSRSSKDNFNKVTLFSETYCGTPGYVAPEVLKGEPYDPFCADIWSLGVCLYLMLCNRMPFGSLNISKMVSEQENGNWKFPMTVDQQLSVKVKKLVTCLMEPDISKRLHINEIKCPLWPKLKRKKLLTVMK